MNSFYILYTNLTEKIRRKSHVFSIIHINTKGRDDRLIPPRTCGASHNRTPVAAAEPSAPNKAVSTATATFKIVFHLFIIVYLLSALLMV